MTFVRTPGGREVDSLAHVPGEDLELTPASCTTRASCLPARDFETRFTFAQVLPESASAGQDCLLPASLAASDTATSPHAQGGDIEIGGQRGREALAHRNRSFRTVREPGI